MSQPLFSVQVSDIEKDDQQRTWEIPIAWLSNALADTDAVSTDRTGQLTAQLSKSGGRFLVRGRIRVRVELPCARTLEPAIYDLSPELFLLLRREVVDTPGARPRRNRRRADADADEDELTDEDAAADSFSGDTLHLDDYVREQVLLELPMFPLRSDLRLERSPPIGAPPQASEAEPTLDPRLAPLQRIAQQLSDAQPAEAKKTPVKK